MKLPDSSEEEYKFQITKLIDTFYSYSWEDNNHRIRRNCNDIIKYYVTKDNKIIDGVTISSKNGDHLSKIMEVYYYDDPEPMGPGNGRPYRHFDVEWDGKTLENAVESLTHFMKKKFIRLVKDDFEKLFNERERRLVEFWRTH